MRKSILTITLMLVLCVASIVLTKPSIVVTSSKALWVPDDYTTIQEAVNSANEGEVIRVRSGVYPETIILNKTLFLIGENKYDTIIEGNGTQAVEIVGDYVTLTDFTVRNGSIGVSLYYASDCNISNNIITRHSMYGISCTSSDNNTIGNNHLLHIYQFALMMSSSSTNNTIQGNLINQTDGICEESGANLYKENTIFAKRNSSYGIPINVKSSENTVICNLILNGSHIVVDGHRNYIANNTIKGNLANGLYMTGDSNIIAGNIMINNANGIALIHSDNNTIVRNIIERCTESAIWLHRSSSNRFHHNYFADNVQQVHIETSGYANFWDNGSEGNYWSDYEERYPNVTEIDGSGIWDTPYALDENNQDNYPIVPEFPSFLVIPLFMTATLLAVILYRRIEIPR